ncbi:MAG TPA: sigma-70 family RNA polymerase sigma factor [Methylomirabilota bacterium]|nr:sigma-70 family RNA polymerase sigma factor [Methylomirabilota bacterium]
MSTIAPSLLDAWAPYVTAPRPEATRSAEDAHWLSRVREGDETAARHLIQRLYPTVIKSVRRHLPRRTSEEDLVQAIFAKVFSRLDQFSGAVPLEHWVSRIAINTCLNQLKHEAVRPELRMGDLTEDQAAAVEQVARTGDELPDGQRHAAREVVDKLLDHLRPEERLVITLLHIEERSVAEISRMTGWSLSLVKVRAFRARRRMRKVWRTLLKSQNL